MTTHQAKWLAPAPFWSGIDDAVADRRFASPAILRFADDDYMDKLLDLVDTDPMRLRDFVLRHETWRDYLADPLGAQPAARPASGLARQLLRLRVSRRPAHAAPKLPAPPQAAAYRMKVYQPAHQRHYLLMTSLVCETLGFPDKAVDAGQQEVVGFVLRRLFPRDATALDPTRKLPAMDPTKVPVDGHGGDWVEHAFVPHSAGGHWVALDDVAARAVGEETLPLFPLAYVAANARKRRLLAGVVPAGRREVYMGAARAASTTGTSGAAPATTDPRTYVFRAKVTEPWKQLLAIAAAANKVLSEKVDNKGQSEGLPDPGAAVTASREQVQTGSWYVLLDFAKLLEEQLPEAWSAVLGGSVRSDMPHTQALLKALNDTTLESPLRLSLQAMRQPAPHIPASLREALGAIRGGTGFDARTGAQIEHDLEAVQASYRQSEPDALWPGFVFPLADCQQKSPLPFVPKTSLPWPNAAAAGGLSPAEAELEFQAELKAAQGEIDSLLILLRQALGESSAAPVNMPPPPLGATASDMREGWFVMRCVFERPECCPSCSVTSRPTTPFQLAGFFDPDAPARPIRIGLPIDTTPAGFRKFDKNTAIAVSDILCGQIARFKALTLGDLVRSVLPWPLHKDLDLGDMKPCPSETPGLQMGMICSLSIPIITICALILLIIMVTLLDYVFRWLPFFFTCFPLPGFKAKQED